MQWDNVEPVTAEDVEELLPLLRQAAEAVPAWGWLCDQLGRGQQLVEVLSPWTGAMAVADLAAAGVPAAHINVASADGCMCGNPGGGHRHTYVGLRP